MTIEELKASVIETARTWRHSAMFAELNGALELAALVLMRIRPQSRDDAKATVEAWADHGRNLPPITLNRIAGGRRATRAAAAG